MSGLVALQHGCPAADDENMTSFSIAEPSAAAVTVCLVEDHAQVRRQLCDLLTGAGMDVVAAVGTFREGKVAITDHLPDVAVIDNRLPDGSGIDLCRTLSHSTPQVTLLLHTGTLTSQVALEALQAGAVAVIPKSIRSDSLLEAIRNTRHDAQP
jgi:DNA-binding NarL/FixJ family response regulator